MRDYEVEQEKPHLLRGFCDGRWSGAERSAEKGRRLKWSACEKGCEGQLESSVCFCRAESKTSKLKLWAQLLLACFVGATLDLMRLRFHFAHRKYFLWTGCYFFMSQTLDSFKVFVNCFRWFFYIYVKTSYFWRYYIISPAPPDRPWSLIH